MGAVGAVAGFFIGGPAGAYYGFMAGYMLGAIVDPPHTPGPTLGEAGIQTSRDGVPIPIVWGVNHVVGNIIIMNPIETETRTVSSGKGSGPTTTETRAYRDFGIGVCRGFAGPIDGITRIWENDKLVYDVRPQPAIPASETQQFADGITIYLGAEDQDPEPDYDPTWGELNPYFRGLAWVAFHRKDITDFGQSIPTYRFEVNAGEGYQATSLTYPIEVIDAADAGFTILDAEGVSPPIDDAEAGFEILSGDLNQVRKYHTVDPEGVDADFTILDGNLKQVYKYHTVDPEGVDAGFTILSGDLNRVYISYTVDPEGVDVGFTILSGDLNDVT